MFFNCQFTMNPPAVVDTLGMLAALPGDTFAEKRMALQEQLQAMPQAECPVEHHFADGIYIRQAFNPKDVLIVGETQKEPHICFIAKGHVSIFDEDGVRDFKAPDAFFGKPGDKRIVYAHEDSIFSTIHFTTERDIEKLEATLIEREVV